LLCQFNVLWPAKQEYTKNTNICNAAFFRFDSDTFETQKEAVRHTQSFEAWVGV